MAESDPGELGAAEVLPALLLPFGGIERASREIVFLVGHVHRSDDVVTVVAEIDRTPVTHDVAQLKGQPAHAVVLGGRARTVTLHRHLDHVAISVGVGTAVVPDLAQGAAVEVHGLERLGLEYPRVGFVLFAAQMGHPWRG